MTSVKNKDDVRKSALKALKDLTPFADQDLFKEKSLEMLDRIQSGRPDLDKVSGNTNRSLKIEFTLLIVDSINNIIKDI